MCVKIFHTANAGLYFYNHDHGLLIDGLHHAESGFPATPPLMAEQLLSHTGVFKPHIDLAFTHLHPDHFDAGLTSQFLLRNPHALVYGPGLSASNTAVQSLALGIEQMLFGDFRLTAFTTTHDGAAFSQQPHRTFCLQAGEQQYIICGDAALQPLLGTHIHMFCSRKTTAVFLNVYQLASEGGLGFLQTIAPEHIVLYHLPPQNDDPYGYRNLAKNAIARQTAVSPLRIQIPESMCHIHFQAETTP